MHDWKPSRVALVCFSASILGAQAPTREAPAVDVPVPTWPQFRGDQALGIGDGRPTAVRWDVAKGEGVAWRTRIPGLAHSSPVVWGSRVFVTTAVRDKGEARLSSLYGSKGYGAGESVVDEGPHSFLLLAVDRATGKVLWKSAAHRGVPKVKRHPKSSHANPTPACDAGRVVVSFGSEGLFCFSHDGRKLWQRDLGVLNTGAPGYEDKIAYQWGHASSPVLHEGRVFVQCDHEGQSFVAAFDAEDGRELWRQARDEDSTWSTPTVHLDSAGKHGQLILNGYKHIGGYDLETGAVIWKLTGGGDVPVPTPVVAGGLVYLTSAHGRSRPLRAVHALATGDLSSGEARKSFFAWEQPRRGIYMQTPLVYRGLLYACSDGGILGVFDAKTGAQVYRQRLGSGSTGFSGSAVASEGRIYFSGESGEVFVIRAGSEFKSLAVNEMGENCMATPAIVEGVLLLRTRHHLVAIAPAPAPAEAEKR